MAEYTSYVGCSGGGTGAKAVHASLCSRRGSGRALEPAGGGGGAGGWPAAGAAVPTQAGIIDRGSLPQQQQGCSAKGARTSPCATAYWRLGCGWGCWWADSDWMAGWCTKDPLETRMQERPLGTRPPNCAAGAGQAHAQAIRPAGRPIRQIAFRTLRKASRAALSSVPEQ